MTNEQDPDATIKALEEQLAKAKAEARIKALQDELEALKGGAAPAEQQTPDAAPAASEAPVAAPAPPVAPTAAPPAASAPAQPAAPAQPQVVYLPAPAKAKRRGGLIAAFLVMLLALLASLGATYLAITGELRAPWAAPVAAPSELRLLPVSEFGPSAFLDEPAAPVAVFDQLSTATTGSVPEPVASLAIAPVSGDKPELYGLSYAGCRTGALAEKFQSDPVAAAAWAAALNSDESLGLGRALTGGDFEAFRANLVYVHLLADTRVTYNGYAASAIFPVQAVLQKGTLVGVDRFGVPRLHCQTGVPLTAPTAAAGQTGFSGQAWADFSVEKLVTIAPATAALSSFTVLPVGPANVETAFSIAPSVCTDTGPCPAPSALTTRQSELAAPANSPATTQCSNWAPGLGDGDWVDIRFVNASATPVHFFIVQSTEFNCTVDYYFGTRSLESGVGGIWPGTLVLVTDEQGTTVLDEFVGGDTPSLWVVQ